MELILLFLASILAGFALIHLPLGATAFASLGSAVLLIGVVVVLVFAFAIIIKGVKALFHKW